MEGIRRVREREEELSRCEIGGGVVGSSRGAWRQLQWDAIENRNDGGVGRQMTETEGGGK